VHKAGPVRGDEKGDAKTSIPIEEQAVAEGLIMEDEAIVAEPLGGTSAKAPTEPQKI
jgi:hypothetical protein